MNNEHKQSGFSLMDLMVSVAIIGLLFAIAIPEFESYRVKIKNSHALVATKNIVGAINAILIDNENSFNLSSSNVISGDEAADIFGNAGYTVGVFLEGGHASLELSLIHI